MAGGMSLEESFPTFISIPELVERVRSGGIRIPTFQRSFGWDAKDVRDLFDSLYRGIPVGTLIFWRRPGPAGQIQLGPLSLTVPDVGDALWVVDGQKRIISLALALSPDVDDTDDAGERFAVYFDLGTKKFVHPGEGVISTRAIPLHEFRASSDLFAWLRNHSKDLKEEDFEAVHRLNDSLRSYRIPAYVVASDDRDLIRLIFGRVNSAGKPMSRAEVFRVSFAGRPEPSSPASVAKELAARGFGTIPERYVRQSLLAIRGGDINRSLDEEFSPTEDPADWYDRTEQAIAKGIGFLQGIGVPHRELVPNMAPLPALAAFFHLYEDIDPWIGRLLARWLWRGWAHGFGEGGWPAALRKVVAGPDAPAADSDVGLSEPYWFVRALLHSVPDRPPPRVDLSSNVNPVGAQDSLFLLALYSLHPLDAGGNPVDVAGELEEFGTDAVTEIIPELQNFARQAANLALWPPSAPPLLEVRDPHILASYAIDDQLANQSADWRDWNDWGRDHFLRARGRAIEKIVHDFLDSRLEPSSIIRPPLGDLLVAGLGAEI